MQQTLAKITRYDFCIEDHGILAFDIMFDYGGSGQGTGMYGLDQYDPVTKTRFGSVYGLTLIRRVLDLFKVTKLDDIVGRTCFAIREDGWNGRVIGIKMPDFDGGAELIFNDVLEESKAFAKRNES